MPDQQTHCIRFRAILLGLILIPANCFWIIQMEVMWYIAQPTTISLFQNVLLCLVGITLLNLIVKRFAPNEALNPAELITIYTMLCMTTAMCGHDMLQVLTPILIHPFRFSDSENNWSELFAGKLPTELMVSNAPEAVVNFYEGSSSLYLPENFYAWLPVVVIWTGFLTTLVFTTMCMNSLFRKEWTENERLTYPVVELPLAIATDPKKLLWNAPFAWGFCFAGGIALYNGLGVLDPDLLPEIPVKSHNLTSLLRDRGHPWSAAGGILLGYYPAVIGMAYLMPLELMFSCWFFYFFWKFERILIAALGLTPVVGPHYISQQATGGYIAIAISALWFGRTHIKEIYRKLTGRKSSLTDETEALSYKWAVIGVVAGMTALVLFCWRVGMPPWLAFIYFALYLVIAAGVARMRATCGPPAHDLHYAGPGEILTTCVGTENLGGESLGLMSIFFGFNRAYRGHATAHSLEGLKLAERTGGSQRRVFIAQLLGVTFGCICAFWAILHLTYSNPTGATWLLSVPFGGGTYQRLQGWVGHPKGADYTAVFFYITGFLVVALMPLLKVIHLSIPFHPIGFAISTSWSMEHVWFPILIAWTIKFAIVKYIGGAGYRKYLPFFMGLILGDYLVGGFWSFVSLGTGEKMYTVWP
jgi:hypothetical protein